MRETRAVVVVSRQVVCLVERAPPTTTMDRQNLCKLCRSTPFDNLPSLPAQITASFPLGQGVQVLMPYVSAQQPQRFGFPHHQNLEALKKGSLTCPLCSVIHDGVVEFTKNVVNAEQRRSLSSMPMFFKPPAAPKDYSLQITRREHDQDGFAVWTDGIPGESTFLVAAVGYCVSDGGVLLSPTATAA